MGLLLSRLRAGAPRAMDRDPSNDWWYGQGPGGPSIAGTYVSPDAALTLSAVWQAVRILSEGLASLPCITYERLGLGKKGKTRAPEHPLYDLLRYQPNPWQTAFEFWEMQVGHVALRGNAYSKIVEGRRGFADQLVPLHPDRVTPQVLPSGRLRYEYRPPSGGTPEYYLADEIMHLRGLSGDGVRGLSIIEYGTNSFGAGIAADRFAARFFANGAVPSGVAQHPMTLSEPAQDRLRKQIEAHIAGGNQHGVLVLEEGMTWQSIGMKPEDMQLLLTREHSVRDVARWFNVPLHRLADIKTPTHASIEAFGIEQVMYTFRPWAIRFEQAIRRDLILATDRFFSEFLLAALMRGDSTARGAFYKSGIESGWLSRNEARELENLNPEDGLDEFLEPLNMGRASEPREAAPGGPARADRSTRLTLLAFEAAQRCVRKETAAASKAAQRFAADAAGWSAWLRGFYEDHAGHVAATLKIPVAQAREYAARQAHALETHGVDVMADWEWTAAGRLTDLALDEERAA